MIGAARTRGTSVPEPGATSLPEIGVIGLGAMGGAIAGNLLAAGFHVRGFDLDADRVAALAPAGLAVADSVASVAGAEIVITSLPGAEAFETVFSELTPAAQPGSVVIETSTLAAATKEQARARLACRDVTLLDCPLSGTGHQAVTRDLVVLASGDAGAVARCEAVFHGFARAHHYLGAFGVASTLKLIANLLVAIHNVAAAEALVLAQRAGLDPQLALEVLIDGAGSSRMLEVRGPHMLDGDYRSGVSQRVFAKDLALIAQLAVEHGTPVPLFALSSQVHLAAAAQGFAEADTASVVEVVAALAGAGRPGRRPDAAVDG